MLSQLSFFNAVVEVRNQRVHIDTVSAGAFGWSMEDVARIAVDQARQLEARAAAPQAVVALELIRFVLASPRALTTFERELSRTAPSSNPQTR